MRRYFFIAKNNIKKQRGDMITFFILCALASLLIFISLSFLVGTGKVIDTNRENINGADILVLVSDNEAVLSKIEEIIKGTDVLKNYEKTSYLSCNSKYRKKGQKKWIEYPFHLSSYEEECRMQTMSIDGSRFRGNDIVLPISLKTTFKIGDTIQLKIEENIYDLKVAGYNEDNFYCSPMNLGTYRAFVSDRVYEDIRFENPIGVSDSCYVKSQLSDRGIREKIDTNDLSDEITEELLNWFNGYLLNNPGIDLSVNVLPAEIMKTGSMILPFVFIALVLLFALIMFVIAIVIINFGVKNFIMTNMRNTAIMEASGYTVRELVLILMCQLVLVGGLGALIGIVSGALLIDKIGIIILITLGLPWNQPTSIPVAAAVFFGFCLIIALLTLALGREYSRISVLDALRGGVNTHNFKKNLFSFEKTSLPIPFTLALKETFGKFRSQIGIIFIMMILAISTVVAFGMVDTYGNEEGVLAMGGFDFYDAYLDGSAVMAEKVAGMNTVQDCRRELWMSNKFYYKRKTQTITTRSISDTSLIRGGSVVEGRWPAHPNEVMFATNAALRLGVGVGDSVTIKSSISEESYLVCGICQTMNNMGMMAYMTLDGQGKVTAIPDSLSICLNLKPGSTFKDFEEELKDIYPDVTPTDYNEAAASTVGLISNGMKIFAYFIALLTILIVAFVESLIVRTNINRQWRNMGVSKALGFTSGQLIGQVMMSNMPAILMGVGVGLLLSPALGGKLMIVTLAIFGFRKTTFGVSPLSYLLTAVIILGVALLTAGLLGRRIKTLEPVKMITEE